MMCCPVHATVTPIRNLLWLFCVAAVTSTAADANDWPTYCHDIARSGVTSEVVRVPLNEGWVFQARHAPQPAWDSPDPDHFANPGAGFGALRRLRFDDAFHVAVVDGAVYFGSSVDNKIYCLDASSGRVRWTRITGGPIRLAPSVADGRVFVGSDDGWVWCLRADDGSVIWKRRAAPEDRRVLGHGKMISLWPVRTGVLVDGDVAYFGAGIFPAEGIFLHAVRVDDGREIWRNDACGEDPQSRVSPQGYLLASKTTLYAPTGRISPAAFERRSGRLLYEAYFRQAGGTYALLADQDIYTGTEKIVAYRGKSGDEMATFQGEKMVIAGNTAYLAGKGQLTALDRKTRTARWTVACPDNQALILAGDTLLAGGAGRVVAIGTACGKVLWKGAVKGSAKGLAVAAGQLLVSTDRGTIHCFRAQGSPQHGPVTPAVDEDPYRDSPLGPMFRQAAETILSRTSVKRGYCLVLGCETGQLALELARRSELMIYVVEPDAAKVAAAREALDAAGVHGDRVCVEQWPLEHVPYSDYFANLVVSETAMVNGTVPGSPGEAFRMLKPLGGTAILGQPSTRVAGAGPLRTEALRHWLEPAKLEGSHVQSDDHGIWLTVTRGPLPGAGSWTHQYANPGNTACSDDQRVKCPLGILWFGKPGPEHEVERHLRAAAPLSIDGRLFVEGLDAITAYDAYNGLELWRRDIPGAMRTNVSHNTGNLALDHNGLFVAAGDRCLRLEPSTGRTMATYELPLAGDDKPRRWGYVACVGKRLYGSRVANPPGVGQTEQPPREKSAPYKADDAESQADCLFALDIESGKPHWVYPCKPLPQNSLAIGDDSIFFVSPDLTPDERRQVVDQRQQWIESLPEAQQTKAKNPDKGVCMGRVVALDARTGRVRWQTPVDLTGCGGDGHAERCWTKQEAKLGTMVHNGVLVVFGVYLDGHHWARFFAGQFDGRRIIALRASDGQVLWSRETGFRVRPLIIGDTLHAEPWKFDLQTGEPETRINPITGQPGRWQFARPGHHCGCPSASPNCLFFRSFTLGYYDLFGDFGTIHFGGQRPGCWINAIAAAGLVLVPEASAGCTCAFPNACTVAFQPKSANKAWGMYSAPGPIQPVERLALNLGMSGDRNDAAGKLWLGYPRPYGNPPPGYPKPGGALVLRFDLDVTFYPGGGFDKRNSFYTNFTGTDDPWLFASAAHGLHKIVIPLLRKGDPKASYRVRLALAALPGDKPGQRVFDIKLQDRLVEEEFDIVRAAGGTDRVIFKEFTGIEVRDNLSLELVAREAQPAERQWPVLQAIEITRQTDAPGRD